MSIPLRIYLGLVVFSLMGSQFSVSLGLPAGPIASIASVLTLFAGFAAILYNFHWNWRILGIAMAVGAVAEICGVYTGLPFGRYAYTENWWPSVIMPGAQPFPLMLPVAWAMVVGACWGICDGTRQASKSWMVPLLATATDFAMEGPMTKAFKYWKWTDLTWPIGTDSYGMMPRMNSVGWYLVAGVVAFVFHRGKLRVVSRWECLAVLLTHVGMILGLSAIQGVMDLQWILFGIWVLLLASCWMVWGTMKVTRTQPKKGQ